VVQIAFTFFDGEVVPFSSIPYVPHMHINSTGSQPFQEESFLRGDGLIIPFLFIPQMILFDLGVGW